MDSAKRKGKNIKMEFSKKLTAFATAIYGLTWAVAVVSWFMYREFPQPLMEYGTWLYGATLAFYKTKALIENKSKYGSGQEDES